MRRSQFVESRRPSDDKICTRKKKGWISGLKVGLPKTRDVLTVMTGSKRINKKSARIVERSITKNAWISFSDVHFSVVRTKVVLSGSGKKKSKHVVRYSIEPFDVWINNF